MSHVDSLSLSFSLLMSFLRLLLSPSVNLPDHMRVSLSELLSLRLLIAVTALVG